MNEMYDPEQDTWTELNHMSTKRSGLTAASVGSDIFVMGGEKAGGSFDINEKYDTVADSWTLEPSMPDPRLGHDAVTSNDKIYILGGKTNQSKDTVIGMTEIFIVDDVSNSQLD